MTVLVAGTAAAAMPTAAIHYVAPPECPGVFKFLSLVEERTAGRWQLRQAEGDSDFVVEIREAATGKVGRVRRADRSADGAREIASGDCGELVQALALSTVLSLDDAGARRGAGPVLVTKRADRGPEPPRPAWILGGGASNTALLPSQAMPGLSLFVENGRRLWPMGVHVGRPDFRFALMYARSDLGGGQAAKFALSDASLAICPVGAGLASTVSVRLCAVAEAGMLSGEGVAVDTPQTTRFPWVTGGAVARLRWAPGRRVVLEGHVGAAAPFERTTFIFEMPRVEVAKVPAIVASGGLTVGWSIP